jgi:hypothetical protein
MDEIVQMDEADCDLDDPCLLPRCEVQNLQGCKVLEGHCRLDVDRRVVSVYPSVPPEADLDGELFLTIRGDRLRLHGVLRADGPGEHPRYDGRIGEEPVAPPEPG